MIFLLGLFFMSRSFFSYWKSCYTKNYANFFGRACRKELCGLQLMNMVCFVLLGALCTWANPESLPFVMIISVGVAMMPSLAVIVRRLHDLGRSGWFILLLFIPVVNIVLWLFLVCVPGEPGANVCGLDPKKNDKKLQK